MIDLTPTFSPILSFEQEVILPQLFGDVPGQNVGGFQATPAQLQQGNVTIQGLQERILIGSASAPDTGVGIFIGNDGNGYYDFRAGDPSGNYIKWDGSTSTLTVVGTITASAGTIGGFSIGTDYIKDVADSFGLASTVTGGDDVRFWAGASFANRATAPARITEAGAATFSNVTVTGGSITGTPIASIPNNTSTDISLLGYQHDIVFSVTDADTVAWASGTITLSNGRTFSISSGNTGNMAARTYIYLDPGTSSTVLQTTTTASTAIGANKILIAVAQNGSGMPTYQVYGGAGGLKLNSSGINLSNNNWVYSGAFSVTDADTIAWASGTLKTSDGTSYSISGSNTGNMAAKTYIYFDLGTSSTAFQTTTTATTAIGDGKILIAIAQNGTNEANYLLVNDKQMNLDAANIVTGSITANELSAGSVTATKISVTNLAAISADLGAITAGTITVNTSGYIRGGATDYLTGTGFFLGYSGAAYKFSVGNPAANYIAWDGSSLIINGYLQSTIGTFGGDGSDGALSISSGTTTIDCANAAYVVKNYTSISITGTGKLAFSNPASGGTMVVLKSQGNVTITSSTAPCVDMSGMGAAALAGPGFVIDLSTHSSANNATAGGNGGGAPAGAGGSGSTGGDILDAASRGLYTTTSAKILSTRAHYLICGGGGDNGANGGTGTGGSAAGGTGNTSPGRGGGALMIECRGAWNFTTAGGISVAGTAGGNGTNGANAGSAFDGGGGGGGGSGGGGGGSCLVMYKTLTANSGTITITGGAGGSGGTGGTNGASHSGANQTGGGGGGGATAGGITAGSNGSSGAAGQTGASPNKGGNGGAGATGATGYSVVVQNSIYS